MVKIENLTKVFKEKVVLQDISLEIEKGKIYGLIGNNGAGKTTLLNCIAHQCKPTSGKILFQEHPLQQADLLHISYFLDHSIFDEKEKVRKLLDDYAYFFEDFNLEKAKDIMVTLFIDLDEKLGDMSMGERKKCELALVLARDADLYLLDEPFANMDPLIRQELLKMIVQYSREDASYLISTHQIQEIETYIDETILLKNGKLVLAGNNDMLREEYQCNIAELLIRKLSE